MNWLERFESWLWIRPIPSRPPPTEHPNAQVDQRKKAFWNRWKSDSSRLTPNAQSSGTWTSSIRRSLRRTRSKRSGTKQMLQEQYGPRSQEDVAELPSSLANVSKMHSHQNGIPRRMNEQHIYFQPQKPQPLEHFQLLASSCSDLDGSLARYSGHVTSDELITFRPRTEALLKMQQPQQQADMESDIEDDPYRMLNVWLGELDSLQKVHFASPTPHSRMTDLNGGGEPPRRDSTDDSTVMRRKRCQDQNPSPKGQYRCSLINLEQCTQDEELDAILGELSILESKFDEEIKQPAVSQSSADKQKKDSSPVDSDTSDHSSGMHSRSSSGHSVENGEMMSNKPKEVKSESPDNDSAFCDNLSVLSSCSTSSGSPPQNVAPAAPALSPAEQEARMKAEKIRLAIEKIKEASIKKIFIKVFTADGSAKSLMVDEKMNVAHVTRILAEKNLVCLDPKWALVELVPDLYMERVYEDHENVVENCLMWKVDSKNTLWFIERPEKFDVFRRPEVYLLGSTSSQRGDAMEDHARQELVEEYFSSSGIGAPEVEGFVWLKAESKKSWKKFYFVLRSSGLYYSPKGKKTSKNLSCLATMDVNQVYYGSGWKKKYKAPTDYCFAIKHPQIQVKTPKYVKYLCVDSERELHQWVTGIRVAKHGRQLYENYRHIEEEITHADIDILTAKRFSGNAKPPNPDSPARTPSSENKSFDSALSSAGVSDITSANQLPRLDPAAPGQRPGLVEPPNYGQLRRSASKSSTSSSSGCLSDRGSSSSCSTQRIFPEPNGFESDFPAGGTIKKRPSACARLPLTSTTYGLVRDSDDDNESCGGESTSQPNLRIGGGGTLLRNSMRHTTVYAQVHRSNAPSPPPPLLLQTDPLSQAFESSLEVPSSLPLPPPPPPDTGADLATGSTAADLDDDDLPPPPPPPEMTVTKKPAVQKRITFDDRVQLIGVSSRCDEDDEDEYPCWPPKNIVTELPNRLPEQKEDFLKDLQRVMTKKWQIAERCRGDNTTPHQVLGFRDLEIQKLIGAGHEYSRDDKVGAWVRHTQKYSTSSSSGGSNNCSSNSSSSLRLSPEAFSEPLYAAALASAKHQSPQLPPQPPPHQYQQQPQRPVVLREPTPELQMSSAVYDQIRAYHHNQHGSSKIPPTPPRRSENTHLTTV